MNLRARIEAGPPERRQTDITPIIERRADEQLPRWVRWTRENESRGKSLDQRAAA